MNKLVKFLKPYAVTIAAIFAVLMMQAYCDLSLPSYTSDIVNVGIQQGGIDDKVPTVLSEEDLQKLTMFMSQEEEEQVKDSYILQTEDTEYDYDGAVYELKSEIQEDEAALDELADMMQLPMFISVSAASDDEMAQQMEMLGAMPEEQRSAALEQVKEKMEDVPDMVLTQSVPVYIKSVYQELGVNTDKIQIQYILHTGLKMLGLALLGMAASIMVGFLAARVAASTGRDLRSKVFTKVIGFSNAEFDKFSTASLITRSTNDIQQIQTLTVMFLRIVLFAPVHAIGGIIKGFHTNVDMIWIIALGVALVFMIVIVLFIVAMPRFKTLQTLVDRLNLVMREILTGLPVIRAFSKEKHEEDRFDKANRDLMKTNLFVNRAMTFMMPLMMLVMNGVTVLIVWSGAAGIDKGQMQVGDMMAFIQYTMQIIMSFLMICMISIMLPRAAVAAERVDEILTSETAIDDPEEPKRLPENSKGEVAFEHVSFRYPGAEHDVLHDLNFVAKPGQTTAIIGSTGCGKSTLINLIPRFYDVTEGHIRVDGMDIREMTQHDLRGKIGYVPQKGVLFSGTIASNILYGNTDGTEEEMKEAASIAQATEFIDEKPKKYESTIAQGGTNVSGGQKQRLSIARAIAKKPEIFIFDDSFSALDYKTDVVLRTALKEKTQDSTVIIVAQRISTILHAEQIIVLDEGKIAGIGTHQELLKSCEAYYQIASSQLSQEELRRNLEADEGKEEC
mgnify:CR=1 FL=1